VGALDFNDGAVRRAVASHVEGSVVDTLNAYAKEGIDGQVYARETEEEAARTRILLERNRHHERFRQLLAGNAEAWQAFLDFENDEWERRDRTALEMLQDVGKLLVTQGQRDLWKLRYLHLREQGESSDTIMSVILRDAYRDGDEFLFVFGTQWEGFLRSIDALERDEEEEGAEEASETPAA